jgi:hypothetical protein
MESDMEGGSHSVFYDAMNLLQGQIRHEEPHGNLHLLKFEPTTSPIKLHP